MLVRSEIFVTVFIYFDGCHCLEEGGGGWVRGFVRRWWRAFVAELFATALMVGLGLSAVMPVHTRGPVPLTHAAFSFGCIILANVITFGPTSGAHMNPAVTLAAVAQRQLSAVAAVVYVMAQAAGAVLGFGVLLATIPTTAPAGCTLPGPGVTPLAATVIEMILTTVLVLACCTFWSRPPDDSNPIKIGLVITGLVYSGGEATGASLNPLRSFGPALLHGVWTHHWVYWVGPLSGSAFAVFLHRFVLSTPPAPPASNSLATEEMSLQNKP